jgi:DNA-binding CsgD family transcriptional regulator
MAEFCAGNVDGELRAAMSEMLGVPQATVKTHLHNLFRKTATSRQSDLVKLMAGLQGLSFE